VKDNTEKPFKYIAIQLCLTVICHHVLLSAEFQTCQNIFLTLKYANCELVSVQIFHIFTNIGVQNPGYQAFKHAVLLHKHAFVQRLKLHNYMNICYKYTVSTKMHPYYFFLNNSIKNSQVIFGMQHAE